MHIDREVLKGHIDTIILSMLTRRPMYGYELAKTVREKSENKFELKEGTMYLALKRMEKKKWIESYWGSDDESGGGRRKYYRIRPTGMEQYRLKRKEWEAVKAIMETFFEGEDPE